MIPARAQVVSEIPRSPSWHSTAQKPGEDYSWIPGHWQWNGERYAWIQGHYAQRPFTGAHWVEGFWQRVPDGWRYVDGYWAPLRLTRVGQAGPKPL
jgi:hypothetical protein